MGLLTLPLMDPALAPGGLLAPNACPPEGQHVQGRSRARAWQRPHTLLHAGSTGVLSPEEPKTDTALPPSHPLTRMDSLFGNRDGGARPNPGVKEGAECQNRGQQTVLAGAS